MMTRACLVIESLLHSHGSSRATLDCWQRPYNSLRNCDKMNAEEELELLQATFSCQPDKPQISYVDAVKSAIPIIGLSSNESYNTVADVYAALAAKAKAAVRKAVESNDRNSASILLNAGIACLNTFVQHNLVG